MQKEGKILRKGDGMRIAFANEYNERAGALCMTLNKPRCHQEHRDKLRYSLQTKEKKQEGAGKKKKMKTNLSVIATFLVTLSTSTRSRASDSHVSPFSQILFPLLLPDFHLLLFSTTPQLIWLEGTLRLEVASMLGNVAVGHD